MTAVTHYDDLYYYVLFALILRQTQDRFQKKQKIKPGPMLSLLGRDRRWPGRPTHMNSLKGCKNIFLSN